MSFAVSTIALEGKMDTGMIMRSMRICMVLLVCMQVSAFIPRPFMQSTRSVMNKGTSQRSSFLPPTCAFLTVGDSVVAEVDDIVGSVGEPMVTFLVR